jgi:hypothetical protein
MAFSTGRESTEGSIKRYIGVASVYVLAVNPTKEDLEKLYERDIENAPVYVEEKEVGKDDNKHMTTQCRIDFIIKADPEKYLGADNQPLNFVNRVSLFLRNEYRYNGDKTKVQVIDKYGRTAWVSIEDAKNHVIPQYSNGPANIDKDYRPAYYGEETLVKFLIAYLNIPSPQKYVDGKWVMNDADKLADSEAGLEHIPDYFKGDFSELRNIIGYQPNNKVKVCIGVRTTDDNKQYQAVYTGMFLKNGVNDYSRLDKSIAEDKNNGAYGDTEFDTADLHEHIVNSTDLSMPAAGSMPFPPASQGATPWGQKQ